MPRELSLREGAGPRWERRVFWATFPMRGGASLGCRESRGWDLVEPLKKKKLVSGLLQKTCISRVIGVFVKAAAPSDFLPLAKTGTNVGLS